MAVVPVLIIVTVALLHVALAGHAALSAAAAARAAARAEYAGGDVERAARRALPPTFRGAAAIEADADRVEVEVRAPRALPLGPPIAVTASSLLGPAGGVPGG